MRATQIITGRAAPWPTTSASRNRHRWLRCQPKSSSALANNFSIAQQAPLVAVSAVGPATETYGSLEPAVVNATITWTGTGAAPTGGLSLASTAPGSFGAVTCDSPNRKAPGTLLSTYDLTCT